MVLLCAILTLLVAVVGYMAYDITSHQKAKAPVVVTQETLHDTQELSKAIKVSPNTAVDIQRKIEVVTQREPYVSFNIQAPTIDSAATQVEKAIKANAAELPKAVTDKTDRTVVVPNDDKQKVDVYKINLNKAHKLKAGVTVIDTKAYATVAYQAGKFEVAGHFDGTKLKGATALYTIKEW